MLQNNFNKEKLERSWRFSNAIAADYSDLEIGDVAMQNYSVVPVTKHIGVILICKSCWKHFTFSAKEQKRWYEVLKFWIDSVPTTCKGCRKAKRKIIEFNSRLTKVLSKKVMTKVEYNEMVEILYLYCCEYKIEIGKKLRAKALMAAKRSDHKNALNLVDFLKQSQ